MELSFALLVLVVKNVLADNVPIVCTEQLTPEKCTNASSNCEWSGSMCERTCSSWTTPYTCASYDKCQWSLQEQCEKRPTYCYRWDLEEICIQHADCEWDENTRSCSNIVIEEEAIPVDPNFDRCSIWSSEASCQLSSECEWRNTSCFEKIVVSTSAPTFTREDTSKFTVAPTPTKWRDTYCNDDRSSALCLQTAVAGITCIYADGLCHAVIDFLGPPPSAVIDINMLWVALTFTFAVVLLLTAVVINMKMICLPSIKLGGKTRQIRFLQLIFSIVSIVLFGVLGDFNLVAVPIMTAVFGCGVSIVLMYKSLPQNIASEFSLFLGCIIAAASASKTSKPTVLVGSVMLDIALMFMPWLLFSFVERASVINRPVVNVREMDKMKLVVYVIPRLCCVILSLMSIAFWIELITPNIFWVATFVTIGLQLLIIPASLFSEIMAITVDVVGIIMAVLGAVEANFENMSVGKSIISFLVVLFWAFAFGVRFITVTVPKTAKINKRKDLHNFSSKQPSRQKVFASPSNLYPQQQQLICLDAAVGTVSTGPTIKSKPSKIPVSIEINELNLSNLSQGSAASTGDYKREMAIV
jgi:hypothetical protein